MRRNWTEGQKKEIRDCNLGGPERRVVSSVTEQVGHTAHVSKMDNVFLP